MKKVIIYNVLLFFGMLGSQFLPLFPTTLGIKTDLLVKQLTMTALAFIMIHVGIEFRINKNKLHEYFEDYIVAFITASVPWVMVSLYFIYNLPHPGMQTTYDIWTESFLVGRFSASTSAGVLFTMLAGAGLHHTWLFKKARILAIFDDLDTILFLIPLKMLILGIRWELGLVLMYIIALLIVAWKLMHRVKIPFTWKWVLSYAILLSGSCELVYYITNQIENLMTIHLEVLLPAFVLGTVIAFPDNDEHKLIEILEAPKEVGVQDKISAFFMFLVGLSMPALVFTPQVVTEINGASFTEVINTFINLINQPINDMSWSTILYHTAIITVLSNIGKMVPAFCYKKEAPLNDRIAVGLGMCPRGEVGAGIIVVSMSLLAVPTSPIITIAILSLAANLLLTGPIIHVIKTIATPEKPGYEL